MSVSEAPVPPDQISTFSIFTGIQALYWPSVTKNKPIPPYTDSVPQSTNHCCSILTQCTPSSPRNAQLSQLDLWLILSLLSLCQMIFSPILGWLSNKIGKIRPVRAFLSQYLTNSSFMVLNVLKMIESDFLHQTVFQSFTNSFWIAAKI